MSAFISPTARNCKKKSTPWLFRAVSRFRAVLGCFELFRAVSSECFHFDHSPELQKKRKRKKRTVAVSGCFELFRAVSSECFHFDHSPELQKRKEKSTVAVSGCFGLFRVSAFISPTALNCKKEREKKKHGGCFGLFRAVSGCFE